MITYAALFKPIDLFDPSTETILLLLFVVAVGLLVVKFFLRKRYHTLIEQLPEELEEPMGHMEQEQSSVPTEALPEDQKRF